MPIIDPSLYKSHPSLLYKYSETIASSLLGHVEGVFYDRERLELADGDFLDLDWIKNGSHRLVILSAGMEGSSDRNYIKSTAKFFSERGWDVLAWNYRACSGELNRFPRTYSYAETEDFSEVIDYTISSRGYSQIALIGFSMGGCLVTKYLGQNPNSSIIASVTFSVSCDLKDSMKEAEKPRHFVYNRYFMARLIKKLKLKAKKFEEIRKIPIDKISTFDDYVRWYAIPFHNFKDVHDFYAKSSCEQYIPFIKVPSLMVNALNDPILGKKCYPYKLADSHDAFFLETPASGGHLGFPKGGSEKSWMPQRAFEFISAHIPKT